MSAMHKGRKLPKSTGKVAAKFERESVCSGPLDRSKLSRRANNGKKDFVVRCDATSALTLTKISGLTLIEYLKHRFLQLHNRASSRPGEEQRPRQKQLRPLVVSNSRYPLDRLLGPSSITRNLQRATDRRRPTTGRCISPHDAAVAVVRRVDILFLLLLSLPLGQHTHGVRA